MIAFAWRISVPNGEVSRAQILCSSRSGGPHEGLHAYRPCFGFSPPGKSVGTAIFCPSPFSKIIPFSPDPNQNYKSCRLVPPKGRIAIVTNAGRDAVDAKAALTNVADADG